MDSDIDSESVDWLSEEEGDQDASEAEGDPLPEAEEGDPPAELPPMPPPPGPPPDPPPPGPPPAPHPAGRGRARVGRRWGAGDWELAPIRDENKDTVGCGAYCKDHWDAGDPRPCKKSVTIGRSGLSFETLRLRMKRWLIAGLDDDEWDEDGKRTKHTSMGGMYLAEFADGLSEEDCDRIAGIPR